MTKITIELDESASEMPLNITELTVGKMTREFCNDLGRVIGKSVKFDIDRPLPELTVEEERNILGIVNRVHAEG